MPTAAPLRIATVGSGDVADCSVLIVTYNSAAHVGPLLDSLPAAADGLALRVVVVDNASQDGTARVVAARAGVTVVASDRNRGYAGGINVGRRHLGPHRSVAILNPDLRLEPGALRRLHETAVQPHAGAAVPRMLDEGGALSPSLCREPTITRAIGDALLGAKWPGRPGWLSEIVWSAAEYERPCDAEWATGAALVIARDVDADVGPWDDTRFFLYSEETDYCRRLRRAGYTIRYVPEAVVIHRGGGSGASVDLAALTQVNRLRYYRKHHGRIASAAFGGAVLLSEVIRVRRPENRRALRALLSRRSRAGLPGEDGR